MLSICYHLFKNNYHLEPGHFWYGLLHLLTLLCVNINLRRFFTTFRAIIKIAICTRSRGFHENISVFMPTMTAIKITYLHFITFSVNINYVKLHNKLIKLTRRSSAVYLPVFRLAAYNCVMPQGLP
jgi:hypothetical protein